MKTNQPSIQDLLTSFQQERLHIAEELQNEINQTLASVLLWIQHARVDNHIPEDPSLTHAERNLKEAIDRLRKLHYALSKQL